MTCGDITVVVADDFLFRRLFSDFWVPDGSGGKRVSAGAFKRRKPKGPDPDCSVTLERLETKEQALSHGLAYAGVARFSAGIPLGLDGHSVVHTPKCHPDDPAKNEPGHCTLLGLTKDSCDLIAAACDVVIDPQPRPQADVDG